MSKKKSKASLGEVSEVIQLRAKPQNEFEIESLVLRDMRKQILNDEMNQIQFYDIVQNNKDETAPNLKDLTKIPIKLHRKIRRSDLEMRLRNKLADEPGSKLLLQEIYEKLEDDGQALGIKKKYQHEEIFKGNQEYKIESNEQLVANLDNWHKQLKKKKKEERDKLKKEQEQREKEEKEQAKKLQMSQRSQTISNFRRAGLSLNRTTTVIQHQLPQLVSSESSIKNNASDSLFKQKILGSLAKLQQLKKVDSLHQDLNLTKQLDKYMHQGSTLTSEELFQIEQARQKQEQERETGALIFDYTVEGLKNSLHTLIKMQITTFQNAIDRAVFYEKQTTQILETINKKLEKQKKTVENNEKDLYELRMENHEIHKRLRRIEQILQELQTDFSKVTHTITPSPRKSVSIPPSSKHPTQVDTYMLIATKQNEIEDQMDDMRDSQLKYQSQMKSNSAQIQKLENENTKLQKNNKALKKSIQGFLLELLKIGLDCRKHGLCWIVKSVWDSGEKIHETNFPNFLDTKAREFLVLKAEKIQELNKLIDQAHQLFNHYQGASMESGNTSILTLLNKNNFSQIDSQEIKKQQQKESRRMAQQEIDLLLMGMSNTERNLVDDTLTYLYSSKRTLNNIVYDETQKKVQKMFGTQNNFFNPEQSICNQSEVMDLNREKLISDYQELQKLMKCKELEFKKFEEAELQRIVKEIEYRKYLQRFNVEGLQLLASLFGYHKAERELIKYGITHKMDNDDYNIISN